MPTKGATGVKSDPGWARLKGMLKMDREEKKPALEALTWLRAPGSGGKCHLCQHPCSEGGKTPGQGRTQNWKVAAQYH